MYSVYSLHETRIALIRALVKLSERCRFSLRCFRTISYKIAVSSVFASDFFTFSQRERELNLIKSET